MNDSEIPLSLRTRSAVGESALMVARQSIYFDLFAALLNFGITPPPGGTPSTSIRMRLLPDFCTLETKKSLEEVSSASVQQRWDYAPPHPFR
jgi:hypothetical protein